MRIIKPSEVVFVDDKIESLFFSLDNDDEIKRFIERAIKDISVNAFCGIQIPKRLFPKDYVKKY